MFCITGAWDGGLALPLFAGMIQGRPLNKQNWSLLSGWDRSPLCTASPYQPCHRWVSLPPREGWGLEKAKWLLLCGHSKKTNNFKVWWILVMWHRDPNPLSAVMTNHGTGSEMKDKGLQSVHVMCKVMTDGHKFQTLIRGFPLPSLVHCVGVLFFHLGLRGACKQ